MSEQKRSWFGRFRIGADDAHEWVIGPTTLRIQGTETELHLEMERGPDPLATSLIPVHAVNPTTDSLEPRAHFGSTETENGAEWFRVARTTSTTELLLLPRMADRAVIVRPREPFYVPGSTSAKVFVSTPLWIEGRDARSNGLLFERPLFRPSDTWFGPNTIDGERAYASRTSARRSLDRVGRHPHRAITQVVIRNESSSPLAFEHLRIPAPQLGIWTDSRGELFTEALTLVREQPNDRANVRIEKSPPKSVSATEQVSDRRSVLGRGGTLHSFGKILRLGGDHV